MLRCYKRKACFPSVRRWLLLLVPGTLFAGAGLIIFAFFETNANYQYTHSAWHACISLSIVFLLPPRPSDRTGNAPSASISLSPRSPATDELSSLADSLDSFSVLASLAQLTPAHEPWGDRRSSRENSNDVPLLRHHAVVENSDRDDVPLIV